MPGNSNTTRFIDKPNIASNISVHKGNLRQTPVKITASVAIEDGSVLTTDGAGAYTKATSSSTSISYILLGTIATTDSDYATAGKERGCLVLSKEHEYEVYMPVGTGTAIASMEGSTYDLKDEKSLDVTAQVVNQFKITKVLSSTLVLGYFIV